ncbi:MAG: thioredoxin family protein, partial [Myxococcota bacterium]|nr:thioredoxin family protein [Myxococcota bacterium]
MSAMARKMMWSSMALSMALAVTACEKKATPTPPKTDTAPASTSAQTTAETTSAATTPKLSDEQLVKESRKYGHIPIVGDTDRASVTAKFENWKKAEDEAKATEGVGAKLVAVPEGATITIVFGTWCSDCFREIPRLWDALDQVEQKPPFEIKYVAVNEYLRADRDLTAMNIHNIPTLIVERDGKEVGRIIEKPTTTVEEDLLALL